MPHHTHRKVIPEWSAAKEHRGGLRRGKEAVSWAKEGRQRPLGPRNDREWELDRTATCGVWGAEMAGSRSHRNLGDFTKSTRPLELPRLESPDQSLDGNDPGPEMIS